MIVVEISAEKKEEMTALCERMLLLGGHLMHCLSGLEEVEVEEYEDEEPAEAMPMERQAVRPVVRKRRVGYVER